MDCVCFEIPYLCFFQRSPSLMKTVSSSLDFGNTLNASLQVRTAALPHYWSLNSLKSNWFLIHLLCRRHWLRHHCQDSRRSVWAETPGVKWQGTKRQTATVTADKTSLHESSSEFVIYLKLWKSMEWLTCCDNWWLTDCLCISPLAGLFSIKTKPWIWMTKNLWWPQQNQPFCSTTGLKMTMSICSTLNDNKTVSGLKPSVAKQ